jgi:phosphodiesterase/alkaline phosphatase D-like protein
MRHDRSNESRSRILLVTILPLALIAIGMGPCAAPEFDLGVGAFEIGPDRAILWTHAVPPDPDTRQLVFRVDVATDDSFSQIVRSRPVVASSRHDFTARIRIVSLDPATQYYYRFVADMGGAVSPTGSFRTAPAEHDGTPVRFVVSGDSNLGFTLRCIDRVDEQVQKDLLDLARCTADGR